MGSPTTRSLFAYLILHRGRPTDRRRLAFLLWPRGTESAARRNLRQYLHRIRRALEPVDPNGEWLISDGTMVQFSPQAPVWLDVEAFRQACGPSASLDELQAALNYYRGDLLEDLYEDWAQEERHNLRQQYLATLDRVSQQSWEANQLDMAIMYTQKWISSEPLDENAHRRLMMLYTFDDNRHLAIQHYQTLKERLMREMGSEPLPETQALISAIQSGELHLNGSKPSPLLVDSFLPELPKPSHSVPLVGRQNEVALLEQSLDRARSASGGLLLVTGESGIGKTRLVQDYLETNSGLPVLKTVCHELESNLPYAPLRHLIQQAIDLMPQAWLQSVPPWLPDLLPLIPSLAERFPYLSRGRTLSEEKSHLADSMINLLLNLVDYLEPQPLQLVMDDLHWGDGPTWSFLSRLAYFAATHRLLIIGLCRLEDLPPERQVNIRMLERDEKLLHIPLRRLNVQEIIALATHLLPEMGSDPIFIPRLHHETEGNPFFIIEMVRAVQEFGWPGNLPGDTTHFGITGMPLSIQRVIEARLDRLSSASQELLATAAVIGREFDFALLQQISQAPIEQVVHNIEEWTQRGLVREETDGYDFSHEKIRQVVYGRISRARRQLIHGRIASLLVKLVPPAEATTIAYHYTRSDQPFNALPYLTQAGEQALHVRSYQEARSFGLQAVSILGRVPGPDKRVERVDLNLQLAQAYAFTGDLARAQDILSETEHLADHLGDQSRLANLYHRLSQVYWLRGQPTLAGDYARRTLRKAEDIRDTRLFHAALRMLGRVGIAISAFDDAIAYLNRYIDSEESFASPPNLPIVLGYLGVAYSRVGSWQRAVELSQKGVALAVNNTPANHLNRSPGMPQSVAFAHMQLAFIYADRMDWQACQQTLDSVPQPVDNPVLSWNGDHSKVREIADRPGENLTPLGFMLLGLRGLAQSQLGEPNQGAQTLRKALTWAEKTDYRVFYYLPRMFLAQALLLSGDLEEAFSQVIMAMDQAREAGNRWAVGVCQRHAAEILVRHPMPDWIRVEDYLIGSMRDLRQVRARPDLARTFLALRKLYDRAGQIAWAVDCHFRAISLYEEMGMSGELRQAQGQAASDRRGAVVIPGMGLRGPNTGT